jgi:hypothetical protein
VLPCGSAPMIARRFHLPIEAGSHAAKCVALHPWPTPASLASKRGLPCCHMATGPPADIQYHQFLLLKSIVYTYIDTACTRAAEFNFNS